MRVVYETKPKRFRIEQSSFSYAGDWEHIDGADDYEDAEWTVERLELDNPTTVYRIVDTEAD